ncbi:MAG: DoxX family protein [Bacteroidetes bacterium]|nr:DoxX family protein [Bacteroidota bacterium]
MKGVRKYSPVIGRVLIALIFVLSGFGKIMNFDGTLGFMQSVGIPFTAFALVIVIAIELLGGISLILGLKTKWVAGTLIIYTAPGKKPAPRSKSRLCWRSTIFRTSARCRSSMRRGSPPPTLRRARNPLRRGSWIGRIFRGTTSPSPRSTGRCMIIARTVARAPIPCAETPTPTQGRHEQEFPSSAPGASQRSFHQKQRCTIPAHTGRIYRTGTALRQI